MRAAVMSCTGPGSTSETHSGSPSGAVTAWMLPPWAWALPEYHRSGDVALDADGWLLAPVAGDDLPVQDHMREPLVPGPFQRLGQPGGLRCQHVDDLIEVAVGGGPRNAVVTGQRIGGGAVAEPAQPSTACQKQASARLPRGVPRRRRSASSSFATNQASSVGTSSVAR